MKAEFEGFILLANGEKEREKEGRSDCRIDEFIEELCRK